MERNLILPTVGPISEDTKKLIQILNYANVLRINGSHNTLKWHQVISNKIKNLSSETVILLDIPGIKPRTKNKKEIKIKKNELVRFEYLSNENKKNVIPISNFIPSVNKKVKEFTLSDGTFKFNLKSSSKKHITGVSKSTFTLKPNKGINIADSIYDDKKQLKTYINFIQKSDKIKFDAIGISYIQSSLVLRKLKKLFPNKLIVSKIENKLGLKNIESICKYSDAIMIDRGDLSAEINEINLFNAILDISKITKNHGLPLIMATENLDSMNFYLTPKKNEIISMAVNNILNVDKIMLSDETATSKNWLNNLKWLKNFTKNDQKTFKNIFYKNVHEEPKDFIIKFLKDLKQCNIIVFSKKGHIIKKIKKINPLVKIIVFTDSIFVKNVCSFYNNIKCIKLNGNFGKKTTFIFDTLKKHKKHIFEDFNKSAVVYINNPKKNSRANTITLIEKNDF